MKILITGAYGQLGNEIKSLAWKFPDWRFLFTDADTLDISDERQVADYFKKFSPGCIVNCAAYTAVDKAETEQEAAWKINAEAPKILAKNAAGDHCRFIHISTDYVFDGNAGLPYRETDPLNPQGVYGKSKREGENGCLSENQDSVIIRTSWLYSAFGNNFVKTMLRLGSEKGGVNVVFDQVGTPTYAADLAAAILDIIQRAEKEPEKWAPGIYHYSGEGVASWYDFAKAIFEISGIKCNVKPVLSVEFPSAAKRPNYSVLDKTKIKSTFGLTIPYWRDSLRICLKKLEKTK